MKHLLKRLLSSKLLAWGLIAVGAAGLIMAAFLFFGTKQVPRIPQDFLDRNPATQPSIIKPGVKTIAAYKVAPDLPKYISIPSINVPKSRVINLSLLPNGRIAVPDNVYDAGWYDGSAKPGQAGAMFIYGHLDGNNTAGIFWKLHELKIGNEIDITRGDNKEFIYKVVALKTYALNNINMRAVLSPYQQGTQGLNLMTCAGKFVGSEYNERLVVFTTLVNA